MQTNVQGQVVNPSQMQPVSQVQMQPVNQFMQPIAIPLRNQAKHVQAYKGLAITQLVIGVLNLVFGVAIIASFNYTGFSVVGTGIWNGIFILIAGIIGVVAVKDLQHNSCANGTYMAFSIIATLFAIAASINSVIAALLWCISVPYCWHEAPAKALYWILFLLNVAEIAISITAAVFCCRNTDCCGPTNQGVIVAQPGQVQYQTVAYPSGTTTANTPQSQATGVPAKGATAYPQQFSTVSYPGQVISQAPTVSYSGQMISQAPMVSYPGQMISQAPNGMIITSQPHLIAGQAGQVNVTYSAEHPQLAPPAYSPMG